MSINLPIFVTNCFPIYLEETTVQMPNKMYETETSFIYIMSTYILKWFIRIPSGKKCFPP